MEFKTKTINVSTQSKEVMQDITHVVQSFVNEAKINNGRILLFVPHTTAAITINENADPDVQPDMILGIQNAFPDNPKFTHMEGNSDAHIKSSMIGVDQHIIIKDGKMVLGMWQGIYFCEFDGPRNRSLHMQIHGE